MSPNCDFPHRCLMPNCNGDFWPKSSISMSMFEGPIILVHLSHVTCQNEPWIEHTILIDDCLIFQLCRGVFQIFFGMPGSLSDFHYFSCIYSYSVLKVVLLQKHWKGRISHSWKKAPSQRFIISQFTKYIGFGLKQTIWFRKKDGIHLSYNF